VLHSCFAANFNNNSLRKSRVQDHIHRVGATRFSLSSSISTQKNCIFGDSIFPSIGLLTSTSYPAPEPLPVHDNLQRPFGAAKPSAVGKISCCWSSRMTLIKWRISDQRFGNGMVSPSLPNRENKQSHSQQSLQGPQELNLNGINPALHYLIHIMKRFTRVQKTRLKTKDIIMNVPYSCSSKRKRPCGFFTKQELRLAKQPQIYIEKSSTADF